MLSEKQLLANQQNALCSTGPRTAAGKAIASQNAIRHGLRAEHTVIPGEDAEEFDSFRQMMLDHLKQPLLAKYKQQRTGPCGPLFGDSIAEDLPPYFGRFQTCEQATAVWDTTDDGIAYAEGKMDADSANDSFLSFLRQCRNLDFEPTDHQGIDLPAAIAKMRNDSADNSKLFVLLAEIEKTFRSIAHIPFSRRSITATRLFLRDMGRQVFASDCGDETLMEKVGRMILELDHIEKSIQKRLSPNLGQTLSNDFEGSNHIEKFLRYEGHIERSLYKALTELQKLQILRSNRWISASDPSTDQTQSPALET